jgi:hypothetical protein
MNTPPHHFVVIEDEGEERGTRMTSKRQSEEDVGSDIELISIDEEEFKNSFEGLVRIGKEYQVEEIPEYRRITKRRHKLESCIGLVSNWIYTSLDPVSGKLHITFSHKLPSTSQIGVAERKKVRRRACPEVSRPPKLSNLKMPKRNFASP